MRQRSGLGGHHGGWRALAALWLGLGSGLGLGVGMGLGLGLGLGLGASATVHAAPAQAAPGTPGPVRALHHGDTLFHFYQGQHFSALSALMVSQHFQRLGPDADEAEVLRGGLLLSWGLHAEAGAVFARLIEHHARPAVRDRAWYFLARIRAQRGLHGAAEAALARIEAPLPGELEEARQLLHAQLLMTRGDHDGAAAVLQALADAQPAGRQGTAVSVARFNLGVALLRAGTAAGRDDQAERGRALLDRLGQQGAADEEQRHLRDRANVALGFAALQARQPERAQTLLQRVRLHGMHANKALLGFGWAAAERGQPEAALVPLRELVARGANGDADGDTAVLEAQIALPYALAEAGASAAALDGYQSAVLRFESESVRLADAVAVVRSGTAVRALLAGHGAWGLGGPDGPDASGADAESPGLDIATLAQAAPLAPLLATHSFHEGLRNLRDLDFIGRHLAEWQARLSVFDDMLTTRQQAWAERLPAVLARSADTGLPALQARHAALASTLAQAEAQTDAAALADARELALQQRLDRARATLARLGEMAAVDAAADARADTQAQTQSNPQPNPHPNPRADIQPAVAAAPAVPAVPAAAAAPAVHVAPDAPAARDAPSAPDAAALAERLRRVAGALTWSQTQAWPARLWQAKKGLRQGGQALDDAAAREAALRAAQDSEPARHAALAARVAVLALRLDTMRPQVAALAVDQQAALQDDMVAALQQQQQALEVYAAQARLALAQLLDRVQMAQRAGVTPR